MSRCGMNTRVRMTGTAVDDTERLWAIVLAAGDGKRLAPLVAQPRNLDTGPGILLPLTHVLAHDPGASVRGMQDGVRR